MRFVASTTEAFVHEIGSEIVFRATDRLPRGTLRSFPGKTLDSLGCTLRGEEDGERASLARAARDVDLAAEDVCVLLSHR